MNFSSGVDFERSQGAGLLSSVGWFSVLLVLAVIWPDPIRWANDSWWGFPLRINARSFLGREAPEWDVVYWCIAGLFGLGMLHGRIDAFVASMAELPADVRALSSEVLRRARGRSVAYWIGGLVAFSVGTMIVWIAFDMTLIAAAESFQSDTARWFVRLFNRFGGGMNPVMIVAFVLLAGMVHSSRSWRLMGIAMALASVGSGLLVNGIKLIAGRSRPEVWLGPFHFADASATSFPSGHTVGVFAIAGVLLASRVPLSTRVLALILASGVGVARVLSYRHWPSDVIFSAMLGLVLGGIFMSSTRLEA